jgi:hypothetical protein
VRRLNCSQPSPFTQRRRRQDGCGRQVLARRGIGALRVRLLGGYGLFEARTSRPGFEELRGVGLTPRAAEQSLWRKVRRVAA